jgi:type IV pilus assembly protein PilA
VNCPACGNPATLGERFCRVCGQRVPQQLSTTLGATATAAPPAITSAPITAAETSGKAIASLIFGLFIFFFPASIVAIVLGHLSLSEIRKSAGRLKGEGLSIAGLVLGYMGVAGVPFILIIAAIAIPNLLRARMAANEAAGVASIRILATAEATYSSMHPDVGYTCSLSDLGAAQLIGGPLASGQKSGYTFELSGCTAGEQGAVTKYRVFASPLTRNQTGIRNFCADESAVIKVKANGSVQQCLENGSWDLH